MFDAMRKKLIKEIIDIAQMKQKYWEQLVDGYNKIDDLKKQCIDLSRKIIDFKTKFKYFMDSYGESLN